MPQKRAPGPPGPKGLRRESLAVTSAQAGRRLDLILAEGLGLSRGQARKLIVAGAVYVASRRVRIASKELPAGAKVDAYVDRARLAESRATSADRPFEMASSDILYEDADLIVVDKPAGLPTQPTLDDARDHLVAAVKRFLARRNGGVDPYLGLHHRLDRDTSGVVLFTKRREANAGAARLFAEHLAEKTYLAWVVVGREPPPEAWEVRNYLGRVGREGKRARFGAVRSGGDSAHTLFRVLERHGSHALVEARPRTGRTHQIRVHLSEGGWPIAGDDIYCTRASRPARRLMLHAWRLTFPHPITRDTVSVESPPPRDFRNFGETPHGPATDRP